MTGLSNKPEHGQVIITEKGSATEPFQHFIDEFVKIINDALFDDRRLINWRGVWSLEIPEGQDTAYERNDQVRDGAWLMIANKDTDDRAAPQTQGDPFFVSTLTGTLNFITETIAEPYYITGNRFTFSEGGFVGGLRWYAPETSGNFTYEVWLTYFAEGLAAGTTQVLASTIPTSTGWQDIVETSLIVAGAVVDVIMVVRSVDQPNTFSSQWDVINSNTNDPAPGEAIFRNDAIEIRVHHVDDNGVNQQSDLEAVEVGGTLSFAGVLWAITAISDQSTSVRYTIAPNQGRPTAGVQTLEFKWGTADPVPFVEDSDFYIATDSIEGFSVTTYPPTDAQLNDNGYGVDIFLQEATVSDDWELVSYSGG